MISVQQENNTISCRYKFQQAYRFIPFQALLTIIVPVSIFSKFIFPEKHHFRGSIKVCMYVKRKIADESI